MPRGDTIGGRDKARANKEYGALGERPPAAAGKEATPHTLRFTYNPPPSLSVQCRVLDPYDAKCHNTATQFIVVDMADTGAYTPGPESVPALVPACDDCIARINSARANNHAARHNRAMKVMEALNPFQK